MCQYSTVKIRRVRVRHGTGHGTEYVTGTENGTEYGTGGLRTIRSTVREEIRTSPCRVPMTSTTHTRLRAVLSEYGYPKRHGMDSCGTDYDTGKVPHSTECGTVSSHVTGQKEQPNYQSSVSCKWFRLCTSNRRNPGRLRPIALSTRISGSAVH